MKLRIITDSSSDYTVEEAKQLGISLIPLTLSVDGNTYRDGVDLLKDDFYDLLINQKKSPKTSQLSPGSFIEEFEDAKIKGETVLVLPICQALSGTYNSAMMAKGIVEYDNIYIVDTCTTIAGLQILVEEALRLAKAGVGIEQIIESLDSLKKRIVVLACMNTLEYLVKGGRLSSVEGMLGNLLNLKPLISFQENGSLSVINKPIGRIRANANLIKYFKNKPVDENYPIYYYYSYDKKNLDNFTEKIKKEGLYRDGKTINLSPVVGCHIGDGAYGIVYVKKE